MRKLTDIPALIEAIRAEASKPMGAGSWNPAEDLLDFVSKYGMERFQAGLDVANGKGYTLPETTRGCF